MKNSKELEFISVDNEDEEEYGMDQAYAPEPSTSAIENALGNSFLKQSKVCRTKSSLC